MTQRKIDSYLDPVPAAVRHVMLEDTACLKPGAAAVMGRFFTAIRECGAPLDAPGETPFRKAAQSESTLATLLWALHRYAPMVSTVPGRDLRKSYYRQRSGTTGACDRHPRSVVPVTGPDIWPSSWRRMWPALQASPIRDSSKRQYLAAVSRCADMLARLDLPAQVSADIPGYFVGISLGEAFVATGVRSRTASGYLDGVVALMRAGEANARTLDGLRAARDHYKARARMEGKLKTKRIQDLMACGGFDYIIRTICRLRDNIVNLPDHAARAERLRQTIAVLMVLVNKPARTGDIVRWRFGQELCRSPGGGWTLDWCQGKTQVDTGTGRLWPETSMLIDELVLRGRPSRLIGVSYHRLLGANWLTGSAEARPARMPSDLVRAAIGVPAHDLRTLAADYLRLHDPETSAAVVQSHLGHGTRQAGADYRSLAEGDAAAEAWHRIRHEIARHGGDCTRVQQ